MLVSCNETKNVNDVMGEIQKYNKKLYTHTYTWTRTRIQFFK